MNRKSSGVSHATATAERTAPANLTAAVDALVHGYNAELEIYSTVRALTYKQRDTLCNGWDLDRFGDLLDEKEDLLQMIGQVESVMKGAKALVLGRKDSECPNRWQLERLLDHLARMIEEIRALERVNASFLETALAAG
ncbi:MAG: flagellar export chaperone FlgN [Candidatus Brocadiia bacterium]